MNNLTKILIGTGVGFNWWLPPKDEQNIC